MNKDFNLDYLDRLTAGIVNHRYVFGSVFCCSYNNQDEEYISASGNMSTNTPYYIASINKMIISSLILQLHYDQNLNIDDKLHNYLPEDQVKGLHIHKGHDYSHDISIRHLLSHTSGLPDYLTDKQANGRIAIKDIEAGHDHEWPLKKVFEEIKKMKPHFPPGMQGKAKYSDTNHHILAYILERVKGVDIIDILNDLFKNLGMSNSFVFTGIPGQEYSPVYYKSEAREISRFIKSTRCDVISTASDQVKFLKAFFNGFFFPQEKLSELEQWNRIFFPFKYGLGIQKFELPRIFSPFKPLPQFIGHSGSTGSLAFYNPKKDLFITGTVNQQAAPRLAFQVMIKFVNKLK